MTVKIVTDSSADLPEEVVKALGITVMPLYVRFGDELLRDRVDISEDEFYERLQKDPVHPNTVQPTPQDFVELYQEMAKGADGIVSIHISSKLSGTCNSALQARETLGSSCPIEVVDSLGVTMGLGFIAMATAQMAKAGESMAKIVEEAKQAITQIHMLCMFDTLKYLMLGGRIGKAKALLGSILNVKPILTLKDGEVVPAGQVRTRAKGLDRLFEFVQNAKDIQDLAVVHSTTPDEAEALAKRIGTVYDKKRIRMSRIGPVLGVHMGPGTLIVAIREA